jgi:hypothetical protein
MARHNDSPCRVPGILQYGILQYMMAADDPINNKSCSFKCPDNTLAGDGRQPSRHPMPPQLPDVLAGLRQLEWEYPYRADIPIWREWPPRRWLALLVRYRLRDYLGKSWNVHRKTAALLRLKNHGKAVDLCHNVVPHSTGAAVSLGSAMLE